MGSMVGLMATSKRVYAKGDLPRLLLPVLCPCSEPLPAHASTGDPPTLAARFGSVSCGVIPLGLGVHPPRLESLFPQFCGTPIIKSHWLSRSDSLGVPSPFIKSPRLGSLTWSSEPSQQWGNFSGITVVQFCGSPVRQVWDWI